MKEHQAMYAVHKDTDTDNLHLHVAVNRAHPETLKVIKPNKGFDIETVHKAVARIAERGEWPVSGAGEWRDRERSAQPDEEKRARAA